FASPITPGIRPLFRVAHADNLLILERFSCSLRVGPAGRGVLRRSAGRRRAQQSAVGWLAVVEGKLTRMAHDPAQELALVRAGSAGARAHLCGVLLRDLNSPVIDGAERVLAQGRIRTDFDPLLDVLPGALADERQAAS